MIEIRTEKPEDYRAVHEVNLHAFGRKTEADFVDNLRKTEGFIPELSLVAEVDGKIAGHIIFTRIHIRAKDGLVPVLSLAPMAVIPSHQKQGVGSLLIRRGIEEAKINGYNVVVVVGHAEYYPKFGFTYAGAKGLTVKWKLAPENFMVAELAPDALDCLKGEVVYPPVFDTV